MVAIYMSLVRLSWLPLIVLAVGTAAIIWALQRWVPLMPVTEATVAREHRFRMMGFGALVVLIVVGLIVEAMTR